MVVVAACLTAAVLHGGQALSAHAGRVVFNSLPVPGAVIVYSKDSERKTTSTDERGEYRVEGLGAGTWRMSVEISGFRTAAREVTLPDPNPARWELTLLTIEDLRHPTAPAQDARGSPAAPAAAAAALPAVAPAAAATSERATASPVRGGAAPPTEADPSSANEGFLINGSVSNAAVSPFAQPAAFGNNRRTGGARLSGSLAAVFGASALDARPYSFSGANGLRPAYTDFQLSGILDGPLHIPGVRTRATFFAAYQGLIDHRAQTATGIVPTVPERQGRVDSVDVVDPISGLPFPGGAVPDGRIDAAARALLALYPLPNASDGSFNYQRATLSDVRQHNAVTRVMHRVSPRHLVTASVGFQRTDRDETTLLGFSEERRTTAWDVSVTWVQRFSQRFSARYRYQLTYQSQEGRPQFAFADNISGGAGIAGNAQDPANWGPPRLLFSSGLSDLAALEYQRGGDSIHRAGYEGYYNRGRHNLTLGGELRPRTLTMAGQQLGRGAFVFTGSYTGSDFADFLLGLPSATSIAFAPHESRFHSVGSALYLADDMRLTPELTVNLGARWEFEAPYSEEANRLANLDVGPDFREVQPVTASEGRGPLTGTEFGSLLVRRDWSGIQPRVALTWRPPSTTSLVIRAGYGIYRTSGIYEQVARLLAQQPPFSKAFNLPNSATAPRTVETAFLETGPLYGTVGVDPGFRQGYAHTWQVSAQRSLPGSLTATASYIGALGRRLPQQWFPNTYPIGAPNQCASCPGGFIYLTSRGTSSRHAGQLQVRRRLRGGWTVMTQYTLARAIDDAAAFGNASNAVAGAGAVTSDASGRLRYGLDGGATAQDWRSPDAERGPSAFDQRHQLAFQGQYTTGIGRTDGAQTMLARLLSGWAFAGQLTVGSGLPFTPIYPIPIGGSALIGLRPSYTGAPVDHVPNGLYLNPAAFGPPATGQWGDVGRNSARGPRQFSADASLAHTFTRGDRTSVEWRLDASNVFNRVTYSGVGTIVGTPQFGRPVAAARMRKVQTALRFRF
jgi:hypothetical protein